MTTPKGKLLLLALTVAVAMPAALAQTASPNTPHYTHRELTHLIRTAHTTEQFAALAAWYRSQENLYNQKAIEEKAEWDRRKAATASPALKYLAGPDPARNLYDYYLSKSNEMASHALIYEHRLQ